MEDPPASTTLVFIPPISSCRIPLGFITDRNERHPLVEDAEEVDAEEVAVDVAEAGAGEEDSEKVGSSTWSRRYPRKSN